MKATISADNIEMHVEVEAVDGQVVLTQTVGGISFSAQAAPEGIATLSDVLREKAAEAFEQRRQMREAAQP